MNIREAIETMFGPGAIEKIDTSNVNASSLEDEVTSQHGELCASRNASDRGNLFVLAGGRVLVSWKIAGPNQWRFALIVDDTAERAWHYKLHQNGNRHTAEMGQCPNTILRLSITS